MPVYQRTYRSYEGVVKRRFRWFIVLKQELLVLSGSRIFKGLILVGYLHVMLRALQIMCVDMLAGTPNNPLVQGLRHLAMFNVDGDMFFDFLRIQTPLVFLTTIFAGAGMVCDDFSNNLIEVYFSKPITWRDYVIGKIGSLAAIGLLFTALPGLFLVGLHVALAPSWETVNAMAYMPPAVVVFSLIIVLPCTLGVLASSAMFASRRYASIGVFMILFGNLMIGRILPELMRSANYAILAFPLAMNRLGEAMFGVRRPLFGLSWRWSVVYVFCVCAIALIVFCRKARRAEIAA
jgi:ABC-type transport system involved in multi-copper enzyme maturation permease subunit